MNIILRGLLLIFIIFGVASANANQGHNLRNYNCTFNGTLEVDYTNSVSESAHVDEEHSFRESPIVASSILRALEIFLSNHEGFMLIEAPRRGTNIYAYSMLNGVYYGNITCD